MRLLIPRWAVPFLAALLAAAGGCGSALGGGKDLTIGSIGWDENVAVSSLTKVILEERLGYEGVELRTTTLDALFEGVASGELDAFQDVWTPNHLEHLAEVKGDVERLDPWFEGETRFGLAAPSYTGMKEIGDLRGSEAELILGIEPSAVIMQKIPDKVIPEYGLDQSLVQATTAAMLAEVDRAYTVKEPIAFVAWTPHWMNQKYDLRYLRDPKGALGALTKPSKLSSIVREDLREDDPVAYALLKSVRLNEEQLNALELEINGAKDPVRGARIWLRDNEDTVSPWLEGARASSTG